METFEFLSVLQIHGFPRLMGVATHMDHLRENKQKKKMQKALRKRFQIEVPPESKLFFMKGLKKGLYDFRDVHNLSRFISVIIPRQLEFKQQHPHVLVDRVERREARAMVFGYVRGADLTRGQNNPQLMVSGLGMVECLDIAKVHDPCPVGESGQKRGLRKHDKKLYAPQCNIGLAMFDETGDYVQIPEKHVVFTRTETQGEQVDNHEGVKMMRDLHEGLDLESSDEEFELVEGVAVDKEFAQELEIEQSQQDSETVGELAMKVHREYQEDNSKALQLEDSRIVDLNRVVYEPFAGADAEAQAVTEFSTNSMSYLHRPTSRIAQQDNQRSNNDFIELILERCEDNAYFYPSQLENLDFYKEHTKCRFVTGFEANDSDEEDSDREEQQSENSSVDLEDYVSDDEDKAAERNLQIEQMKQANSKLITKGSYVRIQLGQVPEKVFKKFSEEPVILSQLATGESQMGFLMVKLKKHRFYRNQLKTNDPLIVSLNFHKYQTVPYFCRRDPGARLRMLKYTPKHEFCLAVFYGNYAPARTGLVALQTIGKRLTRRKRVQIPCGGDGSRHRLFELLRNQEETEAGRRAF